MDMQPKVKFTIYRPYSSPVEYIAKIDTNEVVFSGIEVNEYDKVDITFSSPYDEKALLKMETYVNEDIMEIKPSPIPVTIMGGTNAEHMLVPGHYQFEISTPSQRYFSYYYVKSKDFNDEALLNLRKYLENLLEGLSYDLIKQRLGMANPIPDISPSLLQLFQFLNKHKLIIQRNLEMIIKDPIMDLIGEYRITPHSKKVDGKSIRWQAKKGGQKNSLSLSPRLFYEKHAQLSFMNIENQWIRYIIKYFLQSLRKLEVSFQIESQQLAKKLEAKHSNLEQIKKQMQEIQGINIFGYEKTLESLKRTEKRIKGRIEELEKENCSYKVHKQLLHRITIIFSEFEKTPWIHSIPVQKPKKITQRLLKDYRYRRFYSFYKELFKLETKNYNSNLPGVQFRRTWQLFEYYNVGLIIDILKDNNYKWVDGWLANKDNPHQHIGTLPPDTILRFEKENCDYYIEVAYDTEIESTVSDKSFSRYFSEAGRRPDIRITIYQKDGSLYSEKAGLIIESKCRRHKYIINEQITPDIKWQLRDFWNLEYFDAQALQKGKPPVKKPIKQVIVLYPKQRGMESVKEDYLYGESILYIQVEPSDPFNEEKPFGYDSLKDRIEQFLSQVRESEEVYVK